MGRALKIQRTNTGAGNSGAAVNVDQGFPPFSALTNPVYNAPVQTLDAAQFLGVVGGSPATSTASVTYPEIVAKVNVVLGDGSATGVKTGRIIRQKGSHKFLVAATQTPISDGSFVVGSAYQISTLGTTTNWASVGAGNDATLGDVFTATSVGGSGNGAAYPVGICILSNTATPAAGYMSIAYSVGDSSAVYASYITNKWVRDWNGMTYGNYADSNYGVNIQSSENFYVTNFFTDEGTVTWSGADVINSANGQNGSLQLAQIANVTS